MLEGTLISKNETIWTNTLIKFGLKPTTFYHFLNYGTIGIKNINENKPHDTLFELKIEFGYFPNNSPTKL